MAMENQESHPLEIETPYGKVFLVTVPLESHRAFICAHLSKVTGIQVSEEDIALEPAESAGSSRRPFFPTLPLDANWTHSGNLCVLAYSFEARVGVDVEFHRDRSLKLAKRFFSEPEWEWIESLSVDSFQEEEAKSAFFKLWCRKEAYFKCAGGDFFEGTLRKNLLSEDKKETHLQADGVYLQDLPPFVDGSCLCLAVMRRL